ncbi:hypothetical protein CF319_g5434 [Tilletia indica]|uniref:Cyclin N-terminal domain-containing protein n=1 Tax=Tilletia indica TaxID=43049 RepID=A0A177TR80_9BASI|nr:hypothetical protein CF319_g5434 [Tilletia indica]KAE8258176.1 hypothetical protein A4X13_0g1856 [Tilletia indica]
MVTTPLPEDYYPSPSLYSTPPSSSLQGPLHPETEEHCTDSSAPLQSPQPSDTPVLRPMLPYQQTEEMGGAALQPVLASDIHETQRYDVPTIQGSELNYVPIYTVDLPAYRYEWSARSADQWHFAQDPDPERYACTGIVYEYVDEVYMQMWANEWRHGPDPAFRQPPSDAEWNLRIPLLQWLMRIHRICHLPVETFWLATNIIHRYLFIRTDEEHRLSTVAIAALYIAIKCEETRRLRPTQAQMLRFLSRPPSDAQVLYKAECSILFSLDFRLYNYVSPTHWIWRLSMVDEFDIRPCRIAQVLIDSTIVDKYFYCVCPRRLAASAIFLALKMLGRSWNERYADFSMLAERDLLPCATALLHILRSDSYETTYTYQKYATPWWDSESVHARTWALSNTL